MHILSINFGHDASLTLFKDVELLDFIELERISRLKHHIGIKSEYILDFLKQNKLDFDEIDTVSITNTQFWPLSHTPDIKIEYELIEDHYRIFDNKQIEIIENNKHLKEIKPFNLIDLFEDQLKKQSITEKTKSILKVRWDSQYLDGKNIYQESIVDIFNTLIH